jgi:D-alanyl-lipoteichoic acid acyltransferase DltB (MBOAT superfamily)
MYKRRQPLILLHFQVVALALLHLIYTGYVYSAQFDLGGKWEGYAPGLRQGWIFNKLVDLSDVQWREFRSAAPALAGVLTVYAMLSRFLQRRWNSSNDSKTGTTRSATARAAYTLVFAAIFLCYLHGYAVVYVFGLITANWVVAHLVSGSRLGALCIWTANIGALLAARLTDGFPAVFVFGQRYAWLDQHEHAGWLKGVMRWHICYNLTVLRMLSFALDLHWSRLEKKKGARSIEKEKEENNVSSEIAAKHRQTTSLPCSSDYSLLFALAHALYPPLYIAGPIITYQDFVWQLLSGGGGGGGGGNRITPKKKIGVINNNNADVSDKKTSRSDEMTSTSPTKLLLNTIVPPTTVDTTLTTAKKYSWRLAADLLCIELLTHCMYFNSLAIHRIGKRYARHGLLYNASEVGLTAWWVLTFMWLKFAVFWRTFRAAALLEGIDPPENMVRCFANNYDIEGFWKGWHSSFNRWLVRYMYVPLGGTRFRFLIIWPIFLFVAVWHDLEWRLISWAWIICAAFLPELLVKKIASSSKFDKMRHTRVYTAVSALFAAVNCAGLMAANMIGFVVGVDGMSDLFTQLMESPRYLLGVLVSFYCAMHLNFWWRDRERAKRKK